MLNYHFLSTSALFFMFILLLFFKERHNHEVYVIKERKQPFKLSSTNLANIIAILTFILSVLVTIFLFINQREFDKKINETTQELSKISSSLDLRNQPLVYSIDSKNIQLKEQKNDERLLSLKINYDVQEEQGKIKNCYLVYIPDFLKAIEIENFRRIESENLEISLNVGNQEYYSFPFFILFEDYSGNIQIDYLQIEIFKNNTDFNKATVIKYDDMLDKSNIAMSIDSISSNRQSYFNTKKILLSYENALWDVNDVTLSNMFGIGGEENYDKTIPVPNAFESPSIEDIQNSMKKVREIYTDFYGIN